MMQQHEAASPVSLVGLWAAYERQVIATQSAWQTYEGLARQADDALTAYRVEADRRNERYDAYWAAHWRAAWFGLGVSSDWRPLTPCPSTITPKKGGRVMFDSRHRRRVRIGSGHGYGHRGRLAPVEFAVRPDRHWSIQVLLMLWRWRTELTLTIALSLAWAKLAEHLPIWWALARVRGRRWSGPRRSRRPTTSGAGGRYRGPDRRTSRT